MDSDSITWVNAIRRDSLKTMVRAWQPRGMAEPSMARMGVTRLPWFVVKDKNAGEAYAGGDLAEALAAFRKLMGKPDPKATKAEKDQPRSETAPEPESLPKTSHRQKARPDASPGKLPKPRSNDRPALQPKKNLK